MHWPRRRTQTDFSDEIEAHLALEAERLVDAGMAPDEARLAARRKFGSVTAAKERFYESGRLLWLDHLRQDVRGAARSVVRYPIAALVAVVSLAGGIGATTATLTIRNVVFHKPPPAYAQPGQLSKIQVARMDRPIMPLGSYVPGALYAIWREALGSSLAASTPNRGVKDVRTADRTETVATRSVTPDFFRVLGVGPSLGRLFQEDPADSTGPAPAVLSYRVWQRLFDGRPDVAGSIVWIDNQPHTVVGVLPERFWFSEMNSLIWTRLDDRAAAAEDALQVVVRRPQGTTPELLAARLQNGLTAYASRLPTDERQLRLKVSGIEGTPIGDNVAIVLPYVLAMSVLLTLLIACANVAILMIAQWTAREHEIAIRASLGASRGRIVRALLTESVLLAMAGGALGVCTAFALRGVLVHRTAATLSFFDLSIDPGILIQSAVITVLTGIVAGIAPAAYETRRLHANPLRALTTSDRVRQRFRHTLVVLEITVTIGLLVVTSSMVAGYQRARAAEMGFRTGPLMTARVENSAGVPVARILEVLNRLPGVKAVAAGTSVPLAAFGPRQRVASDAAGSNAIVVERATISADFFSALDVPMRAGRAFSRQDSPAARTAIVNETLARHLAAGRDPIGSRIWIDQTAFDIVGVVADYSGNPLQPPDLAAKMFLPLALESNDLKRLQFLVRAAGDPVPLVQTTRREIRDVAPGNIVTNTFTLDQNIAVMGQEMLIGTAPLVPLIAIGMLLTTAGIYGVLAFAITRRSRELAVRVAIGASRRDLIGLVVAHSLRLVAAGCALGIGVTFGLSRIVRAGGGGGSIYDPAWPSFAIPVLIVLVIGALATWLPSRRALRINPAVLLRTT